MDIVNDIFSLKDEDFGLKVDLYGHEARTARHSHDFIEFTFIEQGFTMHRVEGEKTSLLLPGDIIYILPGTAHEYWKSTNNKVFNCLFYPQILGEDFNTLVQLPFLNSVLMTERDIKWGKTRLKSDNRYAISEILKKIQTERTTRLRGWEIRSKALLIDFLVSLSRVWETEDYSDKINEDYTNVAKVECCKEIKQEILYAPSGMMQILEASEKNRMSVEEMASSMGYSSEHFSRIFKKLTGISPSAYLTSMRMATAAQKLMDERLSIADVAEITGFEDVNYFSRIFKKETGKTPSEFRSSQLTCQI